MKKVVVFGGGTGISCLLSGLKLFPLDVTAVITVSDNGSSTGVLKRELDIPAVGDVGKGLRAMANVDDDFSCVGFEQIRAYHMMHHVYLMQQLYDSLNIFLTRFSYHYIS